jgi:hypothetical protein
MAWNWICRCVLNRRRYPYPTSLNFSLYVERPRLEHLYNVKRTWLTISQLQSESRYLTPIVYLQWFREDELKRQVRLLKEGGFHTVTINLQTVREKWVWERILRGLETVKDQYLEVRPIFTGVSSLKTMARDTPGMVQTMHLLFDVSVDRIIRNAVGDRFCRSGLSE